MIYVLYKTLWEWIKSEGDSGHHGACWYQDNHGYLCRMYSWEETGGSKQPPGQDYNKVRIMLRGSSVSIKISL